MASVVLVTGAGGKTGRRIVQALAKRGANIRAFVRRAELEAQCKSDGASSVVLGDFDDEAAVSEAVKGCELVVHVGPPMHANEVKQTQNVLEACKSHKVRRLVYYGVGFPLPHHGARHHRLKLDCEEVLKGQQEIPFVILQPWRYMQHLENPPFLKKVVEQGVHAMPFTTKLRFSVVDLMDLAEVTATVTLEDGHDFATYELAGPEGLSQEDMAQELSKALGKDVRAERRDIEDVVEKFRATGMSDDKLEQHRVMNDHYDKSGFMGNPRVLAMLLGRPPTTFRAYVERITNVSK